jgi:hypothetical protein
MICTQKQVLFYIFVLMNTKNRLRNSLIRKLQRLSTENLAEVELFLDKIEDRFHSKELTLKLAGTWKDFDSDF